MIGLGHENLESYYRLNFGMIQHHKYSLTEIEDMIPFERTIYTTLLLNYLEEERQKEQERNQNNQMR